MKSGIALIRNLRTDKVWLFWAEDIQKACIGYRFRLDMGTHPCASLQKDYTDTGLEVFRFDTLIITNDPDELNKVRKSYVNIYE